MITTLICFPTLIAPSICTDEKIVYPPKPREKIILTLRFQDIPLEPSEQIIELDL